MDYCFLIILIFVLLSLGKMTAADKQSTPNWCKLSCGSDKNIGCLHENCRTLDKPCELVEFDEDAVVTSHNELRNKFANGDDESQPQASAADMIMLNWDIYLAYLAACNLKACSKGLKHDECHRTEKFKTSGQNLAWSSGKGPCNTQTIDMIENQWYAEIKNIPQNEMKSIAAKWRDVEGKVIGHFTAIVWASTTHIGCAMSSNGKECTFACNYAPAGNIIGGRMYEHGESASKCPENLSPSYEYKALCGKKEKKQQDPVKGSALTNQNCIAFSIFPLIIILYVNM